MTGASYALLFPGQGAQFVGMGKGLAEAFPAARSLFEKADAVLGYPLSRLCWEGPAQTLTRTEHCQPALYVTSLAALAALESVVASLAKRGEAISMTPAAAAGLSLGEYTALAAAGAFSFEDGLRLVRLRAQAMEAAAQSSPGTMASLLGLDLKSVEAICAETGAQVANLNSPDQIVISGTTETIGAASAKAKEKGAKRVIPLEVGGAFHSRLMEPAARRLREALKTISIRIPRFPVANNVSGAYYREAEEVRPLLVQQLTRPVQWVACMETLLQEGLQTFLEVGPGAVLKGLLRKIRPEAQAHSVGTVEQVREAAALLAGASKSS